METLKFQAMEWELHDPTLYRLLAAAHRRAEAIAEEALFELGLTPIDARVLGAISSDERVHATGLARRVGLPVSTVTRALRRLERVGYVELRKGSPFDARLLHAALTAVGRRVACGVRDFERDVDRQLSDGMSDLVKGGLYSGLLHIAYGVTSDATPAPSRTRLSEAPRVR